VAFVAREFPEPSTAAVAARVPVPLAVAVLLLLLLLPGSTCSKALSKKSGSWSWAMSHFFMRARLTAMVLFANSNCCLRWSSCADLNPVMVLGASLPASLRALLPIPVPSRGCLGVTRVLDLLGSFPWGV